MNILKREAYKLATKEAELRELEVSAWIGKKGFKKLFFGRWLFVLCDMKNFRFKKEK